MAGVETAGRVGTIYDFFVLCMCCVCGVYCVYIVYMVCLCCLNIVFVSSSNAAAGRDNISQSIIHGGRAIAMLF